LAKVFGFDIGIKSLHDVLPNKVKEQMVQLCKYCGHSNCLEKTQAQGDEMSDSWKLAIDNHNPEAMSVYK
jgi:hypothetical protein